MSPPKPGKSIIYTGAPLSASLTFNEGNLTAPLQPCFLDSPQPQNPYPQPPATEEVKWRSLDFEKRHLPTGLTQPAPHYSNPNNLEYANEGSLLPGSQEGNIQNTNTSINEDDGGEGDEEESRDDYYDHSLSLHDSFISPTTLPLPLHSQNHKSSFLTTSTTSFTSTIASPSLNPSAPGFINDTAFIQKLNATPITDLKSIPSAGYLRGLEPQTVTVNLLCGIIALPEARRIVTRRGGRSVRLVEMCVGDETGAGWGVNVWLPPPRPSSPPTRRGGGGGESRGNGKGGKRVDGRADEGKEGLEKDMATLQRGDVVVMRNVALSVWQGRVYGQSLRGGYTRVELLWRVGGGGWAGGGRDGGRDGGGRNGGRGERDRGRAGGTGDRGMQGLDSALREKLASVKKWAMEFVGGPVPGGGAGDEDEGRRGGRGKIGGVVGKSGGVLPLDTQSQSQSQIF